MGEQATAAPSVTGHDMSRYWRLVINENGPITGTWWVTRADRRGEQHVKPIDVTMWDEGRHSGLLAEGVSQRVSPSHRLGDALRPIADGLLMPATKPAGRSRSVMPTR